jgi:hypothetical protein
MALAAMAGGAGWGLERDRYGLLVQHGHIVGIKGESYRQKAAAARVSRDAPERPMSLMQSGHQPD